MFFEGFDNDHGGAAGSAGVGAGGWMIVSSVCFRRRIFDRIVDVFIAEELPQSLHLFDANVVGEKPVMTDAVKAPRQYMDEKAAAKVILMVSSVDDPDRPFI